MNLYNNLLKPCKRVLVAVSQGVEPLQEERPLILLLMAQRILSSIECGPPVLKMRTKTTSLNNLNISPPLEIAFLHLYMRVMVGPPSCPFTSTEWG